MNAPQKFLVNFFSDPNFLSVNILENLLANNCFVNVITDDVKKWSERTINISAKNKFNITDFKYFKNESTPNYIIFSSGFLEKQNIEPDIERFLKVPRDGKIKSLVFFPKEIYKEIKQKYPQESDGSAVIFVGDLLGPRIDLESDLKMPKYIRNIIDSRSIDYPIGEVLYPIFVSDAAKQIVRWLFSFGPYGKQTFLLGSEISMSTFWQVNNRLVGNIKIQSFNKELTDELPPNAESLYLQKELNFMLTETYKWLKQSSHAPVPQVKKSSVQEKTTAKAPTLKQNGNKRYFKKVRKAFRFVLILIFVFPVLVSLISAGFNYLSYLGFTRNQSSPAVALSTVVKVIYAPAYLESGLLKNIPLVGQIYKETEYVSYVSGKTAESIPILIKLSDTAETLLNNILGDTPYSPSVTLNGATSGLDQIDKILHDLNSFSVDSRNDGSIVAGFVLSKINFVELQQTVSQTAVVLEKLSDILGEKKGKTYLVLFQNNMELRPTGGFIGSYGLLTFDKGRMSDFTISDIYSADGQLNGHVEPPMPIKQYLGEANWWFRDSNWDPDFPTSAKRAEWFLDKEMDKSVDGVVAIDLSLIKDFLSISGPVFLQDYGIEISETNLYERVQSEVQEEFFPGSYKKTSFLTALSKSILEKTESLPVIQNRSLMGIVYSNLNQRHIQIFLHDADVQKAITNLGWDGGVYIPLCGGNCYSDLIGIVEANVGMNKSNYFIKRNADIFINYGNGLVKKTLVLTLQNSANPGLGVSGRYKSYIRLLIPEDAYDIEATSSIGQNVQNLATEIINSKGRQEVGVITEILGGETKQISFSWSQKADINLPFYNLYIRKQAGVDGYTVRIIVKSEGGKLQTKPAFTLTEDGSYLYNTVLYRDLFAKISK